MGTVHPKRRAGGFTMVELLVVIAIIGILAALLLPALSGGAKRAKRVLCESQLRQIGISFQSFSHDHNSRFPMEVSTNDGGTKELTDEAIAADELTDFEYRHFQTLASYLGTPKILVCPADTRLTATNFETLQNSNISYFVGLTARYSEPMTVLAGDGNLATSSDVVRDNAGGRLIWNRNQHEYKGNVLFADGHVEELNDNSSYRFAGGTDIQLPTTSAPESPVQQAGDSSTPTSSAENTPPSPPPPMAASNTGTNQPNQPTPTPSPDQTPTPHRASVASANGQPLVTANSGSTDFEISNSALEQVAAASNSPSGQVSSTINDDSMMSPFNREIAKYLRHLIFGTYFLILLLLLFFIAYRIWRWTHRHQQRR